MVATVSSRAATFPEDWNNGVEQGATYFSDPMHFPFPITPLTSSTMAPAFTTGFTTAARELKSATREVRFLIRNYYGFVHFDMIQSASDAEARQRKEISEATVRAELPRMLDRWHREHLPAIKQLLERLQGMDVRHASVAELGTMMSNAEAIHVQLWTIHFRIVEPMVLAMQVYDELYADLFGGSDADAHALVVGSLSESVSAGIGLSDLAIAARGLGLTDIFAKTSPNAVAGVLETSENGRVFLGKLRDYLADYGLRQDLFEYATPTWREDPSFALASVRNYLQSGHDARSEHEAIARSANEAAIVARDALATYPEAVRDQFESFLEYGRSANFLQEEHNFHIDQRGVASFRLFYQAVGQRLVDAGLLDAADDVFLLDIDDLRQAVNEIPDLVPSDLFRFVVTQRLGEMEIARALTSPPFIGQPPAGPPPMGNAMERASQRFFGGPPQQSDEPNQLKGNGGSRGTVSGIARVARTLDEAKHVLPGEILVAITTMPAWTPLFGVAAAVVTETGGPLSHCAIVAREYGIPAVVGAHGATQRIETGQTITVDGNTGTITLDT